MSNDQITITPKSCLDRMRYHIDNMYVEEQAKNTSALFLLFVKEHEETVDLSTEDRVIALRKIFVVLCVSDNPVTNHDISVVVEMFGEALYEKISIHLNEYISLRERMRADNYDTVTDSPHYHTVLESFVIDLADESIKDRTLEMLDKHLDYISSVNAGVFGNGLLFFMYLSRTIRSGDSCDNTYVTENRRVRNKVSQYKHLLAKV